MLRLPSLIHRVLCVTSIFVVFAAFLPLSASATAFKRHEFKETKHDFRLQLRETADPLGSVFKKLKKHERRRELFKWVDSNPDVFDLPPAWGKNIDFGRGRHFQHERRLQREQRRRGTSPVPEPSTALLFLAGLAGLGCVRRPSRPS